jgi:hypothetical protein
LELIVASQIKTAAVDGSPPGCGKRRDDAAQERLVHLGQMLAFKMSFLIHAPVRAVTGVADGGLV